MGLDYQGTPRDNLGHDLRNADCSDTIMSQMSANSEILHLERVIFPAIRSSLPFEMKKIRDI